MLIRAPKVFCDVVGVACTPLDHIRQKVVVLQQLRPQAKLLLASSILEWADLADNLPLSKFVVKGDLYELIGVGIPVIDSYEVAEGTWIKVSLDDTLKRFAYGKLPRREIHTAYLHTLLSGGSHAKIGG